MSWYRAWRGDERRRPRHQMAAWLENAVLALLGVVLVTQLLTVLFA